jgi:putative transposase
VDYFAVPRPLWRKAKRLLPKPNKVRGRGRPRIKDRVVLNGIWYILWTGCQWKAVHRSWFGVSASVLHQRFQLWRGLGVFEELMRALVKLYGKKRRIKWRWQSVDSKSCPAPLGGEATGRNPTDRGKRGSKVHLLVDARGAPLAVYVSGANQHDKWGATELIVAILVERPKQEQHFCADRGYDYPDVHAIVEKEQYVTHIKHRRRRGEAVLEFCPAPGEKTYPARRWVVERTLGWLCKRRSIRTRWCKKPRNWLAFIHLACAHILLDLAFFG